ncbi:MAG: hypothetical protein ABSH44_05070 [Bryobacteraceae bacterium]|jgi:hypothetical protein
MENPKSQQSKALLIEGARSYPEALAALSEFRRTIHTAWRDGLESRLGEVSAAMGLDLEPAQIADYANPDSLRSAEIDGEFAALGLQIKEAAWTLYFYLVWWKGFSANVSIWFKDPAMASAVFTVIKKVQGSYPAGLENKEVFISRSLAPEEAGGIEVVVCEMIQEWCRLWLRVGGLRQFQRRAART